MTARAELVAGFEGVTQLVPGLFQGGLIALAAVKHVDVVALCAGELQFAGDPCGGKHVIRVPLNDDGVTLSPLDWDDARAAATEIHGHLRRDRLCLVTCAEGRNRSGLVNALVLVLGGMTGRQAVEHIRGLRTNALTNRAFASRVGGLSAGVIS